MSTYPEHAKSSGVQTTNVELANAVAVGEKHGTSHDLSDMDRMGKLQQLRRDFQFVSIFAYAVILGSTWEYALVVIGISLANGGPAGGIWMFLIVCFGMFFVVLSMAEMGSMAPTSGGQFHWVSEIAPRRHQKLISYIVGWMCAIGWQAAMATTALAATQQLQGLIALNSSTYVIKGWHTTLFTIAITIFALIWNTFFVRNLPLIEYVGFVLHVLGFFAFIIVLWVMGPRPDTRKVWTEFQDNSGWGSTGVSTLVGILGPIVTLIGSDSACHLSEELRDASWVLPRAMVATALVNYLLGFIMTLTVMSRLGDDIPALLTTPFGQPWMQVLLNATGSKTTTSIMAATTCILLILCSINVIITSSRQLFAFARDQGLPFSSFLAYVHPGVDVPINAILVTLLLTTLLSLIIIGSTIAFNVITSLGQVGLISSYLVVIGCIFYKRLLGLPLLPSRFSLGRSGILVNGIALAFLSTAFVFSFFPAVPRPDAQGMNWSVLMHKYVGPVEYVKEQ
ncbi:GABA permease [Clohesyomyces aquaticus]|uniref:GABA permease n=1 Tax=Clohesyomyces aquaticus TaxID=1231657 RepID=A0A1Y1Y949_9PLEO|nr:GABA permease [Clohesyomyces aquaticus]